MDNNKPAKSTSDPVVGRGKPAQPGDVPASPLPSGQSSLPQDQPAYEGPSLKEQKEQLTQLKSHEKGLESVKFDEYKEVELENEVKDWMEKHETAGDTKLNQPVMDDYGQILLGNSTPQQPNIILPLKEEEVKSGLHHRVADSVRWLAEWCMRVLKMVGKRVKYSS